MFSPKRFLCKLCSSAARTKSFLRYQSSPYSLNISSGQQESENTAIEKCEEGESSSNKHPYKNVSPWKSKREFADYLCNQIIHSDDGLVVINKPFGAKVLNYQGGKNGTQDASYMRGVPLTDYSLEGSLPYIRDILNKPDLVLVKSAQRMTSGIAVFADNQKHAEKFQEKLRISNSQSHVSPLYNYLVISVGTPYTNKREFHERVGIQMKSTPLSDNKQPAIVRDFSINSMKRGDLKVVKVNTNVLSYGSHKTTLLELKVNSTKCDFLRVYCADLLLPILGDHLYSCRVQTILGVPTKIDLSQAPPGSSDQKLSGNMLSDLQVRESINVPPHIHLSSYTLRNYRGKGSHLELNAPLPHHFEWTKQQLKL